MQAGHLVCASGMGCRQRLLVRTAAAVDVGKQQGGHAGIQGALQCLLAVGVERLVVEVAVGVDEGHRC